MTVRERGESSRTARWLRGCTRAGRDVRLHGKPCIDPYGGTIAIGDRCTIVSRPVVSHFVAGPGAELHIEDDVWIGHGGAVAAFERVSIGAGTHIGPFVIIMDTNFHGNPGEQSVQHDCRPVTIGRNCRIGSRVTITRGASIGDGAEILAGSVVSSAIPAGACAGGARARLVGPAGRPESRWDSPAAIVPLLVMDAFNMDAPPGIETSLTDISGRCVSAVDRLIVEIQNQFGIALDPTRVSEARIAEIAAAVEHARRLGVE